MSLHKICNNIDYGSDKWKSYCLWRNYSFREYRSLDSIINDVIEFEIEDGDWNSAVFNGDLLTDVICGSSYANKYALKLNAEIVLNFDYIENENPSERIMGYDILDGNFSYSLLSNFGNNVKVVNANLSGNALVRSRDVVIDIHKWFQNNMKDDAHVSNSKIFVVYDKSCPTR
jgi:hypothetical protein